MAAFVAIAGKTVDDATSITHSISTGSGNLLLAICGSKDTTTHSLSISDSDWEAVVVDNGGFPINAAIGVWKLKSATTGVSESLTVTSSLASNVLTLHLLEISGATAVADYNIYRIDGGVSTYTLETVTTSDAGCLVIGSVFIAGRNPAVPTGYTSHLETTNSELVPVYMLTGSKEYAAAGATGNIAGGLSGTGDSTYYSVHFALNSAIGGGTNYADIFRDHAF